jgi:two-component sensor histidine kinase
MAMALKQGRQIRGKEAIAERPDGTRVPFLAYPTPFHDASGKVIGAVNMLMDITERKAAEEQKDLLLGEMRHRMKNTITLVNAIGGQTFRSCSDDERSAFASRLQALASAHDLLTERDWKKASMNEVVLRALQPHRNGEGHFDLSGPDLDIEEKKAVALALALNELATNAQKYGALSAPEGSVKIIWGKAPGKPDCILFRWQEIGGPPVEPPQHRGFGSRLIERGLAGEFHAVTLEFPPDGVTCCFEISLNRGP